MKKIIGITGILVAVFVFTSLYKREFATAYNIQNIVNWTSLFAILSIGVAFVIITGGIDLSIGSTVGLVGCVLSLLLKGGKPTPLALALVFAMVIGIGLAHGLLITKVRLQPFVVTLCGLLLYRGIARWITGDAEQGFGSQHENLRYLATGKVPFAAGFQVPVPFFIMVGLAVVAAIFLNRTIYGRYLLALGRNEQAALYSGIKTDNMVILAYVICSFCAGLGGLLIALDLNSVQPAGHGDFYELYAIAAAVLGGCSLRGGEGSIMGAVIGTALMRVLYNAINLLGAPTQLEFAIIGVVILLGVIADEVLKRITARRRSHATAKEG
jgi:ribose transport system permease protein